MKKNLFDIDRREKRRIRSLHESYSNSHGTLLLREATAEEATLFQETWNDRNPDDKITVDGQIGPETIERVQKFQAAANIKVDGKIGPITIAKMDELDDTWWDKLGKWKDKKVEQIKKAFSGGDDELDVDGDVKGDEELDPDEEGMCPNAKNDRAYRMIKKAVSGWGTDEKLLWKALSKITSWDEYKDMSTVVRCEFPDEFKSVSAMIMGDLGGKDLDKFKGIRRAIKQDGSWEEGGFMGIKGWTAKKKKQASVLGPWMTRMLKAKKDRDKIKRAAERKAKEWGWGKDWSPFWSRFEKDRGRDNWWDQFTKG